MRKLTELIRLKWGHTVSSSSSNGSNGSNSDSSDGSDGSDGSDTSDAGTVSSVSLSKSLSNRAIADVLSLSHYTVNDYVRRLEGAGLSQWPLPGGMTEEDLEAFVFPPEALSPRKEERPLPDWPEVHRILTTEKGATLFSLWETYKGQHGDRAYALTQYKLYYRRWAKKNKVVMRFEHQPGDKVYVDFAGKTMEIVDRKTGEVREVQIFVACLGYSQYIYAEAVYSQQLPDWIAAHVRMFEYFGGVPRTVVCDNLKSAVTKTHRYEPDLNPTYWELSKHYSVVVQPARAGKPRDKSLVEISVRLVTQRILYPLSSQTFHSLSELNQAIRRELEKLNAQKFQKMPGSRLSRFIETERITLAPLPKDRYEYAEWKTSKVGPDYHMFPCMKDGRFYSVPFELYGQTVDVRLGDRTVTVYHRGKDGVEREVAFHVRKRYPGFSTEDHHMPADHQAVSDWTPEKLHDWAKKAGPSVAQLFMALFTIRYRHAEQGVRTAMGIKALAKIYGRSRLNAACERALRHKIYSHHSVSSILENRLDMQPFPDTPDGRTDEQRSLARELSKNHENARGASYYV